MSINVNRNNPDPFYRYKMPRLIAKVEGKGNGIKTVIANMTEVAKALSRPPTYPTKFFGCELGAQTQFDHKNERYIVNGAHDGERLQELLDGFIKRFVLCAECENPETTLSVHAKKGTIGQHCIACGHQRQIDMRHKVTTFMLRNPPTDAESGAGGAGESKKKKKGAAGEEDSGDDDAGNAQQQSAAVRSGDGDISLPPMSNVADEDVNWMTDTSEEAQRLRMNELSNAAANLALDSVDLEKTVQDRVDLFYNFVKERQEKGNLGSAVKDIKREAERLDIADKATLILAELLLTSKETMMQQLEANTLLFRVFTHENPRAQKYLLGGFEKIVGLHAVLMARVPHLLKQFYDLDILDEEVLIEWSKKPSKKYVSKDLSKQIHAKAAPFIKWLEEAEEESEEEEDDEDEVEVVYTNTQKVGMKPVNGQSDKAPGDAAAEGEDDDDDEDINLDDI